MIIVARPKLMGNILALILNYARIRIRVIGHSTNPSRLNLDGFLSVNFRFIDFILQFFGCDKQGGSEKDG